MERESFEDEEVAEVLNNYFVSIKVDREERSDIDSIYMAFCQAYTGGGGWPLTIIMTPERKPFFAGTYFPKKSKYGRDGLIDLLNSIHEIWIKDKKRVLTTSEELISEIKKHTQIENETKEQIKEDVIENTVETFKHYFEKKYGGFSKAPKFPAPHNIFFLLRYYNKTKDKEVLDMIEKTLECMYKGGIFDHIGYGFSRYSTDEKWLVPHFEKMLYDNALLLFVYAEAYKITGKKLYREIIEKIYIYILSKMTSEEGGFYSAEDADSEGIEGKFYVWDPQEVRNVIGEESSESFCKAYDITEKGNFEGKSIPNLIEMDLENNGNNKSLIVNLDGLRKKLYEHREKRVHPFKDDKILTSWNGLMIAALASAGKILKRNDYIQVAEKAVYFILNNLIREDGRVLVRYREGEASNLGVLEDYAFFVWGLIELYECGNGTEYLNKAIELTDCMIELFYDKNHGGMYLYGTDGEALIIRPKEIYDGAIPSGNSVATLNMLRLSKITGDDKFKEVVKKQFEAFGSEINSNPIAYTHLVTAYMYYRNINL